MSSSIIFFSLSKSATLASAMDLSILAFSSLVWRNSTSEDRWALEWGNDSEECQYGKWGNDSEELVWGNGGMTVWSAGMGEWGNDSEVVSVYISLSVAVSFFVCSAAFTALSRSLLAAAWGGEGGERQEEGREEHVNNAHDIT